MVFCVRSLRFVFCVVCLCFVSVLVFQTGVLSVCGSFVLIHCVKHCINRHLSWRHMQNVLEYGPDESSIETQKSWLVEFCRS